MGFIEFQVHNESRGTYTTTLHIALYADNKAVVEDCTAPK